MADLSTTFTGIRFPNPFLLASAPPTESESNIRRAYEAGWGGVVTKTIGLHQVTNVRGPKTKFLRLDHAGSSKSMSKLAGSTVMASWNWELISDKPLDWWIGKLSAIKRDFPDFANPDNKGDERPPHNPDEFVPNAPPQEFTPSESLGDLPEVREVLPGVFEPIDPKNKFFLSPVFLIDPDFVSLCTLNGRNFLEEDLAKTGDATDSHILCEWALKPTAPKAHAAIFDLSGS